MRLPLLLAACGGCVASAAPVIAFGSQGLDQNRRELGLQVGFEASIGPPIAELTGGIHYFQHHGGALSARVDLGWDGAYRADDGLAFGGRVGIGGLKLDAARAEPLVIAEANLGHRTLAELCPVEDGASRWGRSIGAAISFRWNSRGWAIALSPRIAAFEHHCYVEQT